MSALCLCRVWRVHKCPMSVSCFYDECPSSFSWLVMSVLCPRRVLLVNALCLCNSLRYLQFSDFSVPSTSLDHLWTKTYDECPISLSLLIISVLCLGSVLCPCNGWRSAHCVLLWNTKSTLCPCQGYWWVPYVLVKVIHECPLSLSRLLMSALCLWKGRLWMSVLSPC